MEHLKNNFQYYLGAEDVCIEEVTYHKDYINVILKATYLEHAPLYQNQVIQYTLNFNVYIDRINLTNPTRSEQWDVLAQTPVNWSAWWPDKKVKKEYQNKVIESCLDVIFLIA